MSIIEINKVPTVVSKDNLGENSTGAHESILRSYNIVMKVKDLLRRKVPADVVLELIEEMESKQED